MASAISLPGACVIDAERHEVAFEQAQRPASRHGTNDRNDRWSKRHDGSVRQTVVIFWRTGDHREVHSNASSLIRGL
jgi:hypothetical protein